MTGKPGSSPGRVQTPIGPLPADWELKRLGENAHIKARIGWRGLSSDEYTTEGPLLVAGTHIRGSKIDWASCDHISDFRYEESPEIQLQEDDVILSKDGTLGRIGIIEHLPANATINGTMMLVRPDRDVFWPKFLYYYLQGRNFRRFINERVSGSSVPHIFQRDMVRMLAPAPPLTKQRKIAAVLSSVDDAIEKTQVVIDQVQVVKRGLMQELLTRGLPGRHTQFKRLPNWRLGRVTGNLTQIPASWDLVPIVSVARLESGHTPSRRNPEYWHGDVPWISLHDTAALDQPEIYETEQYISELGLRNSSARLLPRGTVVLSRTATIGKSTIMARDMSTTQDFANYVCGPRLHNRYLMHVFRHMQPEWQRLMAGSTHKTVYMPIFEQLEILLPPTEEQQEIADVVECFDARIQAEREAHGRFGKLKSALMSVLLTGELRVTPDRDPA